MYWNIFIDTETSKRVSKVMNTDIFIDVCIFAIILIIFSIDQFTILLDDSLEGTMYEGHQEYKAGTFNYNDGNNYRDSSTGNIITNNTANKIPTGSCKEYWQ